MKLRAACAVLALLSMAFLAGCASTPLPQLVKTIVPVPCQAKVPDRPIMPTESLTAGATTLDKFAQAAAAEIERREGYEGELLAALNGCIAPLPTELPAGAPPMRTAADL